MFIDDKPIETEEDDFLGRKSFSQHLGKALLDWKEKESLVIAIYGEWGSGKSSVINLTIENIEKSDHENKPTIIEFNPWLFSEKDNLGDHFFNEIAKELEIKNDTDKDKKTAKKLRFYASLLNLIPEKNSSINFSSKNLLTFLAVAGILGVAGSKFINWVNVSINWVEDGFPIVVLVLILLATWKEGLIKFANFFEKKADYYSKSVSEVKREIKRELIKRQKKLMIVIDDIDRLSQSEIRQIFRLIRVNADFPNTIYLLAFDRKIVEKNLEEQAGVSGKNYLDKIVQVNFHVPFVNPDKISTFLDKELERILNVLPKSVEKYFGQDNNDYWEYVYSGFKDLFKNIRDVKRFASSLEFNISQMYQDNVMEVNPIDFISIEVIRVFAPDFYSFMCNKKSLFTSTNSNYESSRDNNNPRKKEIEEALDKLPNETKNLVLELLKRLFPQVYDIFQDNFDYPSTHDCQQGWSSNLRICATDNFDSYFTLIPGGGEDELSQFEIEEILKKTDSIENFEQILREYIDKKKIRKVLQRIQSFTSDQNRISQENIKNVIKVLFNISDDLPAEKLNRIIYQLLKRETNKSENFEVLKDAIPLSKGLIGPINFLSWLEPLKNSKNLNEIVNKNTNEPIIPEDKIEELKKLYLEKINGKNIDDVLKHKELSYILYRWKEWDSEGNWKKIIKEIENDNQKLLSFVAGFISDSWVEKWDKYDYVGKTVKIFDYKSLAIFLDLEQVKMKLEAIKKENSVEYNYNKEVIDLFLDNFDKKDKGGLDWHR